MTKPVSMKHLEAQVLQINKLTGSPTEPWHINGPLPLVGSVGNYNISRAFGGVELHRVADEGGAAGSPLNTGHIPKCELSGLLAAFIAGLRAAKEEPAQ